MIAFGPILVQERGMQPGGHVECNPYYGRNVGPNRSGCGNGHRGRLVGSWFTIVEGRVVPQPPGTTVTRFGESWDTPLWNPKPLYNTLHLWCCETCYEEYEGDPPREIYIYPTCFAAVEGCDDAGELYGFVPPVFGLCWARDAFDEETSGREGDDVR